MNFLRLPLMAVVYFCIATVAAEAGLILAIGLKGGLSQDRLLQLLAVAYDVDLFTMWKEMEAAAHPIEEAQISHHDVVQRRRELSLDLDLREIAAEKGLNDMRQLQNTLARETVRFNQVYANFKQLSDADTEGGSEEDRQALLDLQHKLQAMNAKQSKDQLILLLDDQEIDAEASFQIVVTMIKAMPLEKRKKILAEFKSEDEADRLHEILRRIRLGVPEVTYIRDTRRQLQQFEASEP